MARPLDGMRVLDLSRVLAGPWCTQNLADLGAEVIKIERPDKGDDTRAWGPPYLKLANGHDSSEAAYYLATNRGKKSVTIDITQAEGGKLVQDLARHSDIVVENFKVGGLKKYGLDYGSLRAVNPALIYCSITGFGQDGPYAARAGYDFIAEGMGGLMSVTGERDDLPGGGPQKLGVAAADLMTGMYASIAVVAAVTHRLRTGEGQYIDMALLDSQVAMCSTVNMMYLTTGVPPTRAGNAHQTIVPYQTFATADGHVILAVGNDSQFQQYCQVIGRSDLSADARYATNRARVQHRDTLIPVLETIMSTRNTHDWVRILEEKSVPCGPINRMNDVFENPQVQHRQMKRELSHPLSGTVPTIASPMRFSATPVQYTLPPPLLGQHTDEVLHDILGLQPAALDALRHTHVI